jgi:hypothetical protein
MKRKFIVFIALTALFAVSCGHSGKKDVSTVDSTKVVVDTVKVDTANVVK